MSLINDALKRAQADKSVAGDPPDPLATPSRPQRPPSGGRKKLLAAVVLLAGVAGVGAWYFFLSGSGAGTPKNAAAGIAKTAAPTKTAKAAKNAATKPATDLTPELRAIIEKSVAAVNCYGTPGAGPVSPDELLATSGPGLPDEDPNVATPSPTGAGPSAQTQPAADPQTRPAPAGLGAKPPAVAFDASKYKVSGVLTDGDGGAAVINGRIVRVGETIDGAKVLRINGKNVCVEVAGKEHVLGT